MRILIIGITVLLCFSFTDLLVSARIHNISVGEGNIRIAVFASAEDFEAEQNAVFERVVPITSRDDLFLNIPVSTGRRYAIALFHDLNDNGKLDRNLMGIPKEPYAFSNNPSSKWQAPTFTEISFMPNEANNEQFDLELLSWGER